MVFDPKTCTVDTSLERVADIMWHTDCECVPVSCPWAFLVYLVKKGAGGHKNGLVPASWRPAWDPSSGITRGLRSGTAQPRFGPVVMR